MDSRFPEIRGEVNREEEKKGGIAGLLSKIGFGGGGAGGGAFGAAGTAAGGAGLSGGLLATKAGIIGLALIGTTVAGGLGVVGYKVFGPGADAGGGYSSLFESRPAGSGLEGGSGASGSAGVNDGQSASLNYLVSANNKEGAAEGAGEGDASAPTDATADASASASAPSADAVKSPTANNNAPSQGPAAKLGGGKFGSLSKVSTSGSGGGGGGSSASSSLPNSAMLASARAASGGGASGLGAARAASGSARSARRVGSGSAFRALQAVKKDHNNASSSQKAGATYDGGSAGSEIGAENAIAAGGDGVEGAGAGNPGGQGSPTPLDASDDLPQAPPKPTGVNVTPWQAALNTALLLLAGAAMLNFAASKIMETEGNADPTQASRIIAGILASIAIGLSIYALTLAAKIGGGHYGQPTQGALIAMSATFMIAQSGLAIAGACDPGLLSGGMSNLPMLAGGGAMLMMVASYMVPMKKYDSSLFQGGRPPDYDHEYKKNNKKTAMLPSEEALNRYIAAGPRSQRSVA